MPRTPPKKGFKWPAPLAGAASLLFLVSFEVYTLTLNPSLFRNDSPETITACVTLGVSHPPGYPLHTLLGRLFYLLPLGNPAMTLNFFAAVLGAIGVVLLFLNGWVLLTLMALKKKLSDGPFSVLAACAMGSLGLAFSKSYWSVSLAAKGGIYTLQVVLELGLLLFLQVQLRKFKGQKGVLLLRGFYFFLFLFSLGCVNHWPTQALLVPALGLILFAHPSFKKKQLFETTRLKQVFTGLTISLLVLSLYLYLPLRSHSNPSLNFWSPSTAHHFLTFIARMKYFRVETMASFLPSALSTLYDKSIYVSNHFWNDFGALFLLLPALGAVRLWGAGFRLHLLFLAALLGVVLLANLFYLQVAPIEYWHMDDHLLTLNWVVAVLAAVGVLGLVKRWGPWILFPLLFLPILTFKENIGLDDQKREFLFHGYGMEILKSLEKNSFYYSETDYDYFSLLYLSQVEQRRKDVSLFCAPFLARADWEDLAKNQNSGKPTKTRRLYCCFPNGLFFEKYMEQSKRAYLKPLGLVVEVNPPPEDFQRPLRFKALEDFWERYLVPGKRSANPIDGLLLEVCAHPYFSAANYLRFKGDLTHWDPYYLQGLSLIQEPAWKAETWAHLAEGDLVLWKKGVAVSDLFESAQNYLDAGQPDKARTSLQKALTLDPSNLQLQQALAALNRP